MNELADFHEKLISEMAKAFGIPKEMLTQTYEVDGDSMSRRIHQQFEELLAEAKAEFQQVADAMYEEWYYNSLPFWSKVIYQIKKAYNEVYGI